MSSRPRLGPTPAEYTTYEQAARAFAKCKRALDALPPEARSQAYSMLLAAYALHAMPKMIADAVEKRSRRPKG